MKKPTEPSKSAPTANRRRSSHLYLQEKSFRVIVSVVILKIYFTQYF